MENRALLFIIFYAQVWYVAIDLIQLNWHLKAPTHWTREAQGGGSTPIHCVRATMAVPHAKLSGE